MITAPRRAAQRCGKSSLEPMTGRLNRVYEILNGTRQLTLPMIRRLHEELGIPAEVWIRQAAQA